MLTRWCFCLDSLAAFRAEIQAAAWVTASRQQANVLGDWAKQADTDPVMRWGLRITPFVTLTISNMRAGLRLTRSNHVHAQLITTGTLLSDHQARFKRQLYDQVWLPNTGHAAKGPGSNGVPRVLLPEDGSSQLLGPLAARAEAVRVFARDRRRAAMGLGLHLLQSKDERRGQARQQWRRLLEVQQLQRSSDYAMFLLSNTHHAAVRLMVTDELEPLDCYRMLMDGYREAQKREEDDEHDGAYVSSILTPRESGPTLSFSVSPVQRPPSLSGSRGLSRGLLQASLHVRSRSVAPSGRRAGEVGEGAAAGLARSVVLQPHRKTASMVQVLSSVNNTSLFTMMAMQRKGMTSHSGAGLGGLSRKSMGRIPEDGRFTTPTPSVPDSASVDGVLGNGHAPAGLHRTGSVWPDTARPARGQGSSGGSFVRSAAASIGADMDTQHQARRDVGDPRIAPHKDSHVMHSAFTTANAESHAAAAAAASGSAAQPAGASLGGDQGGSQGQLPASPILDSAERKLSFVSAFRHMGRVAVFKQEPSYVHSMPFVDPSLQLLMSQMPDTSADGPATHARAKTQHVAMHVGVHSIGTALHLAVQLQQVCAHAALGSP